MARFDWQEFLTRRNRVMLANENVAKYRLTPGIQATRWLGFPGASEEQIQATECRLGIVLPPSYRDFLKVSNGWRELGSFIHYLYPVEAIDWYAARHQNLIDAWLLARQDMPAVSDGEYFVYGPDQDPIVLRDEYMQTALQISDEENSGGDGVCLLNPKITFADGEWEAWFFAAWMPGAQRYRSFREMIEDAYTGELDNG